MIGKLIKKELVGFVTRNDTESKVSRILSFVTSIVLSLLIFTAVTILYVMLDKYVSNRLIELNIRNRELYSESVLIVTLGILVTVFSAICAANLNKSLFSKTDRFLTRTLPIHEAFIVIPKLIAQYIRIFATFSLIFLSVNISYGLLHNQGPWFYGAVVIFMLFIPLFILFLGTIFSYLFRIIRIFLQNHHITRIISTIIFLSLVGYLLLQVLMLFVSLIANSNGLDLYFTKANFETIMKVGYFAVPLDYVVAIETEPSMSYLILIFVFSLLASIGLTGFIALLYYQLYMKKDERLLIQINTKARIYKHPLLVKELLLLTRKDNKSISFIALAVFTGIFSAGIAYLTKFGFNNLIFVNSNYNDFGYNFVSQLVLPVAILFITMSISILYSFKATVFNGEERSKTVLLTAPINLKQFIKVKIFIDFVMLVITNIISFIFIISMGIFDVGDSFVFLVVSLLTTTSTYLLNMANSLNKHQTGLFVYGENSFGLNSVLAILVPVLISLIGVLLVLVTTKTGAYTYFHVKYLYLIVINVVIILICLSAKYLQRSVDKYIHQYFDGELEELE